MPANQKRKNARVKLPKRQADEMAATAMVRIARDRKADRDGAPKYWRDARGGVRLMAIVEGYAMLRRPGAVPFLVYSKDLLSGKAGFVRDAGNNFPDPASRGAP